MAKKKDISKAKSVAGTQIDLSEQVRELSAIQAQADAIALAVSGHGASAFRDNELSAALFDIESRLMRVRDWLEELPALTALQVGVAREARHG